MLSCLFSLGTSRRLRELEANAYATGVVTSSNGVNIRSGPGTNYGRVGGAGHNRVVTVTGGSGQWWKISYNGVNGYIMGDYLSVKAKISVSGGVNLRSGPGTNYGRVGGIPNGASITITSRANSEWFYVYYGSHKGYACARYISLSSGGSSSGGSSSGGSSSGSWPPYTKVRQGNHAFNSNIRRWGCGFMSTCWCGRVNSISGCNALYSKAIRIGAMRSDCYILNWNTMKQIAGARTYRFGSAGEYPRSNEKEVLQCRNSHTRMHFVVGNGRGSIEYDPAYDGHVAYRDCVSKRFFGY